MKLRSSGQIILDALSGSKGLLSENNDSDMADDIEYESTRLEEVHRLIDTFVSYDFDEQAQPVDYTETTYAYRVNGRFFDSEIEPFDIKINGEKGPHVFNELDLTGAQESAVSNLLGLIPRGDVTEEVTAGRQSDKHRYALTVTDGDHLLRIFYC